MLAGVNDGRKILQQNRGLLLITLYALAAGCGLFMVDLVGTLWLLLPNSQMP